MLRVDRPTTRLTVLLPACLALAACGGPGVQDGAGQPVGGDLSDPATPGGGVGASGGSADGQAAIAIDCG